MYEFVYRILFRDGTVRVVGTEDLASIPAEEADQIAQIKRVEVHTDDWHEVTVITMRKICEGIEARNAHE